MAFARAEASSQAIAGLWNRLDSHMPVIASQLTLKVVIGGLGRGAMRPTRFERSMPPPPNLGP